MGVYQVLVLACALLVSHLLMTEGQPVYEPALYRFRETDLYGLQQLYAEWNKSTPELGKNLAGWRTQPQDPGNSACPCYTESWQGVLCLRQEHPVEPGYYYRDFSVWIVGLTLTDASLTGSLPSGIGNISSLVSLTITGNKDLKGPLPPDLQYLKDNLNVLDLQGNAFNGSLPSALANLSQVQQFDLSGNQFNGTLEVDFRMMPWLRTLNLSRNSLGGNIKQDYLQNLSQLITVDLSSNEFTGPLFTLTTSPSLNSLNLSCNNFSGEVRPTNILNITSSPNLKVLDLSNNTLTGPFPDFSSWTNLNVLDLSYNKFHSTPFPDWIKSLPKELQVLKLRGNNLIGQIRKQFLQDFKYLRILALDSNHLNGTLDIGDVIGLPMLESLSILNNNITNVLYDGSSIQALNKLGINLQGNPYCAQSSPQQHLKDCVCEQQCYDPEITEGDSKKFITLITTSVTGSLLGIVIFFFSMILWKIRREKQKLQLQVQEYFSENNIKPTIFTFNQLRDATDDFSNSYKIGEGSFGAVYKGYLHPNAIPVAVKQLFIKNKQSIAEFLNEVVVVTAIKHRNLVNLQGCCVREDQRLLVYEYLDNKDLEHHLFCQGTNQHLTWPTRFNICLGVARGLHYLHALAQPKIIHRDIKAANILLDKDLQPKIADFGLALFFPDEQSHIMTSHLAGTRGYWAPEYACHGQLSEKADVYSFGVLLLEVVSGRKNLDYNMPQHKLNLCQWGRELYNNSRMMELVDPMLSLSKDEEIEVRCVINIALLCVQVEPKNRPTMAAIVVTLQKGLNLEAEGMNHVFDRRTPLHGEPYDYCLQEVIDSSPLFSTFATSGTVSTSTSSIIGR